MDLNGLATILLALAILWCLMMLKRTSSVGTREVALFCLFVALVGGIKWRAENPTVRLPSSLLPYRIDQ